MANIIHLKDDSSVHAYPVTKTQAVFNDDGTPAINRPVATLTKSFVTLAEATWRQVYVPISLSAGYYAVKISGVLDTSNTNTQIRLTSAQTMNQSDIIKRLMNGGQIKDGYEFTFYVNANQASASDYLLVAQNTLNGGTVTVSVYNVEQTYWKSELLDNMICKPLSTASYKRQPVDTAAWGTCYASVDLSPGEYVVRVSGDLSRTAQTLVRLTSAQTLNSADIVKNIHDGVVTKGQAFYINVDDDEAAAAKYLALSQKTTNMVGYVVEIFEAGQLYWRVDKLEKADGTSLPAYYYENDWLQKKIDKVNDYSAFIHGVSIPFITDLHFLSNAKNSKYMLKEILDKTSCSLVVCGGDFGPAYGSTNNLKSAYDSELDYAGYVGHDKWFSIVGNHDFHITDSASSGIRTNWTWGRTYDAIIKPSERWQVNSVSTGGYYCVDNDVQKTRLIMLNTTEPVSGSSSADADGAARFTTAQLQWLADRLLEHSGYHMIVFSHIATDSGMPDCPGFSKVQSVLEAFANKTTYSGDITANFTSTTNDLICHINGHAHEDASHVSNGVLSICTTCDAYYQDDGYGAERGTVSEQAFDVYCIDYDAETIKTVRFGRGNNRSWSW